MIVVIPKEFLINNKACAEGLGFFDEVTEGENTYVEDWTSLHTLYMLMYAPTYVTWLRNRRIIPTPTFDGIDLSGLTITGSDLRYISFVGANLSNTDLTGSDMRKSVLLQTNLETTILKDVDLEGAYYDGPSIEGWQKDGEFKLSRVVI